MSRFHQILLQYWGFSEFRPLQEEIIQSVASGKDTLGLMPTGGGKSITFQVPAMVGEGICLVVSPLIALMKDQVGNLKGKGIRAELLFSGMTSHEIELILNKCIYGDVKFLYISPERLGSELFRRKVKQMQVRLIAVDESHCISQWGYDFRPSYLNIATLRDIVPKVPVLALTATATPDVVSDIQEKLCFQKKNVFQKSFERNNLIYLVRHVEDKPRYLLKILSRVKGSAVVYARTRKRCRETAAYLKRNGICAEFYHAGLSNRGKDSRQDRWKNGTVQVIVATNAFGMGIDKADVRVVVHVDAPDTLEAYFQEAGRAGRDGEKAYAVMLYSNTDRVQLLKRITTTFPEKKFICRVYEALGNFFQIPEGSGEGGVFDFNLAIFCQNFKFNVLLAYNSLKILQRAGYIEFTDEMEHSTRVHFSTHRDELYKFPINDSKLESFIKLLLRSYTGLFTDYVPVNEGFLSGKFNCTEETIRDYLIKLSRLRMIKYIPKKQTPIISYTRGRVSEKEIKLPSEIYRNRKEKYTQKIHAVLEYAVSKKHCRSRMLVEYFGQKDALDCGECDVCRNENYVELNSKEWQIISRELQKRLHKTEVTLEQLVDQSRFPERKILEVIRGLLDNKQVIYSKGKKLRWASEEKND